MDKIVDAMGEKGQKTRWTIWKATMVDNMEDIMVRNASVGCKLKQI